MARPLPDCAWCGKSLAHVGRVLIRFEKMPYKPEVGWHFDCEKKDPLCLGARPINDPDNFIVQINRRGGRRIVMLRKFYEKGGAWYRYSALA